MKTVIHQLKTKGVPLDGMCYVIQCSDGSIVVVDGGMDNGDAETLLEFLKQLSGGKKPVVDAWFISHFHPDHSFACKGMGERHADEITVRKLIYRLPSMEFRLQRDPGTVPEIQLFLKAVENFKGAETVTPSTGDVYRFGETEFEILYTFADLPVPFPPCTADTNDTTTVFRLRAEGQTVLFLGDVQRAGDDVMIERWGKYLKSDVCQVAHHGNYASTAYFYDYVDPEILLWPVAPEYFYRNLETVKASRHLVTDMRVKDNYVAGMGTVSLTLPVKPRKEPFLPKVKPLEPKSLETDLTIPRADVAPSLDPADPAWDRGVHVPVTRNIQRGNAQGDDSASFDMLWDDGRLYMRLRFNKDFISDPETISSAKCDCVRLYLTERPVRDRFTEWNEVEDKPGYYEKIRFYGEDKLIGSVKASNSRPDICRSSATLTDKGFVVCAALDLALEHKSGDVIGLDLEFNGVREKGKSRAYCLALVCDSGWMHVFYPYFLKYVKLG